VFVEKSLLRLAWDLRCLVRGRVMLLRRSNCAPVYVGMGTNILSEALENVERVKEGKVVEIISKIVETVQLCFRGGDRFEQQLHSQRAKRIGGGQQPDSELSSQNSSICPRSSVFSSVRRVGLSQIRKEDTTVLVSFACWRE